MTVFIGPPSVPKLDIPSPLDLFSDAVDWVKRKTATEPEQPPDPAIVGEPGEVAGAEGTSNSGGPEADSIRPPSDKPVAMAAVGPVLTGIFKYYPTEVPGATGGIPTDVPSKMPTDVPEARGGRPTEAAPNTTTTETGNKSPSPSQRAETPTNPGIRNPNTGPKHDTVPDGVPEGCEAGEGANGISTPNGKQIDVRDGWKPPSDLERLKKILTDAGEYYYSARNLALTTIPGAVYVYGRVLSAQQDAGRNYASVKNSAAEAYQHPNYSTVSVFTGELGMFAAGASVFALAF